MRERRRRRDFSRRLHCGSALISRILCPRRLATPGCDHLSVGPSDRSAPACAVVRLLPGAIHPLRDLRPGGPFLLFCLAPHEVCRAPFLAVGAVGSYSAVSPLPSLARRRFVFCDTVCDRGLHRSPHAFTWHAALWCPDFPLASRLATKRQRPLRPTREQVNECSREGQGGIAYSCFFPFFFLGSSGSGWPFCAASHSA